MSCQQGLKHQVKQDEVSKIELPLSVLAVVPRPNQIKGMNLYYFHYQINNYLAIELLRVSSPQKTNAFQMVDEL